jgi:hypothetical protein
MRDTIIGLVLAAALLAGLFAVAHFYPHSPAAELARTADEVQSGFAGTEAIGSWQLACPPGPNAPTAKTPVPFSLNPNPRTAAAVVAGGAATLGRCHTTLIFRRKDNPKAIVLIVGFRTAGEELAMIVRFPALAKKGDTLAMRLLQGTLKLPVSDCGKEGCLAAGLLGVQAQDRVLASPRGVLVFPALRDGKPLGMLIPFNGLKESVAAMRRAES